MSCLIKRSDVEKLLNQTIAEIEDPNREKVLPDIAYNAMKGVLKVVISELPSIQSVDEEKEFISDNQHLCQTTTAQDVGKLS